MDTTKAEVTLYSRGKVHKPEPLVSVGKHGKILIPASQVSMELMRVKGSFPFDLFPDELIIEEKRLVIKRCSFPCFVTTITIPMAKLVMLEVSNSFFFSSLYIRGFIGYNIETTFSWLSQKTAQKVKDVVDGIRLGESEMVEVLEHDKKNMTYALEKLGHVY